jgi:hypothetical protein
MKIIRYSFLLAIAIQLISSCRKSPVTPAHENHPTAFTGTGLPTGASISKTIGASGGTIASADGKVRLVVPAGALDQDQALSIQPIESKVPLGIDKAAYRFEPHGLHFKKPCQLFMSFTDNDITGLAPELSGLAVQQADGSWKAENSITVDKANHTLSGNITHFSDYNFFLKYALRDSKTHTDTRLVHLSLGEKVLFEVMNTEDEDTGSLFVPLPLANGFVKEWDINGNPFTQQTNDTYGHFESSDNSQKLAQFNYVAPHTMPAVSTIALSAKLDLDKKGAFYLVRNVKVEDLNTMSINNVAYNKPSVSAGYIKRPNDQVEVVIVNMMATNSNNKYASISITIEGYHGPGTYNFSDKITASAGDGNGNSFSSSYFNNSGPAYATGSITITSGRISGDVLQGSIDASLIKEGGSTNEPAPVKGVFSVNMN